MDGFSNFTPEQQGTSLTSEPKQSVADRFWSAIRRFPWPGNLLDDDRLPQTFRVRPVPYDQYEGGNTPAHLAFSERTNVLLILEKLKFDDHQISNWPNHAGKTEADLIFSDTFCLQDLREIVTAFMKAGGAITAQAHVDIVKLAYPDDDKFIRNCEASLKEYEAQLRLLAKSVRHPEVTALLGLPAAKSPSPERPRAG